jgi:hypothetical protein
MSKINLKNIIVLLILSAPILFFYVAAVVIVFLSLGSWNYYRDLTNVLLSIPLGFLLVLLYPPVQMIVLSIFHYHSKAKKGIWFVLISMVLMSVSTNLLFWIVPTFFEMPSGDSGLGVALLFVNVSFIAYGSILIYPFVQFIISRLKDKRSKKLVNQNNL